MHVIFGSSGTVGSALLSILHRQGQPTRAVYRSRELGEPALETARVDLSTGAGLSAAIDGARTVFLATGDMIDQIGAELRVVEAAKRAGVERVVKLSVLSAESEAFFYARIHRAVEVELEASGVDYTHLRPGAFMQNFVVYYGHDIRSGALRLPGPDFEDPFIDARDVARVAAACLQTDAFTNRALPLIGPRALTYTSALETISRTTGHRVDLQTVTEDEYRAAMLPWAVSVEHVDGIIAMMQFHRNGRGPKCSTSFEEVVGEAPRSFDAFVSDYAASWRLK